MQLSPALLAAAAKASLVADFALLSISLENC